MSSTVALPTPTKSALIDWVREDFVMRSIEIGIAAINKDATKDHVIGVSPGRSVERALGMRDIEFVISKKKSLCTKGGHEMLSYEELQAIFAAKRMGS